MTFSFATSTMTPETLMEQVDNLSACTEHDHAFLVNLREYGVKFAQKTIAYAEETTDPAGYPCIRVYGQTGVIYRLYLFNRKACDDVLDRFYVNPGL